MPMDWKHPLKKRKSPTGGRLRPGYLQPVYGELRDGTLRGGPSILCKRKSPAGETGLCLGRLTGTTCPRTFARLAWIRETGGGRNPPTKSHASAEIMCAELT
jgi:hypothetical protein